MLNSGRAGKEPFGEPPLQSRVAGHLPMDDLKSLRALRNLTQGGILQKTIELMWLLMRITISQHSLEPCGCFQESPCATRESLKVRTNSRPQRIECAKNGMLDDSSLAERTNPTKAWPGEANPSKLLILEFYLYQIAPFLLPFYKCPDVDI